MELTVNQIAALVQGRVRGDGNHLIQGAAGLDEATPRDISFLKTLNDAKNKRLFESTQAGAVIIPTGTSSNGRTMIEVEDPLEAFARILEVIVREKNRVQPGIHPLSFVAKSAIIGTNVHIGPGCVVEDHARLEDGVCLKAQVYVGAHSRIGKNTFVYPQVVIREEVRIGAECIIHAGAVIGSDGYGFFYKNGRHNKISQVGTVIIEDRVEVGAGTTIDRATTGATVIREGVKIDNLVQVAHNVEVGAHSLLVAQVGIAGSTKIGKRVTLAGQVGVADHVHVGDGAQVGAQSGIREDVPPGAVLFGTPAQPLQETLRQFLLIRRLPDLFDRIKKLMKEK